MQYHGQCIHLRTRIRRSFRLILIENGTDGNVLSNAFILNNIATKWMETETLFTFIYNTVTLWQWTITIPRDCRFYPRFIHMLYWKGTMESAFYILYMYIVPPWFGPWYLSNFVACKLSCAFPTVQKFHPQK